MVKYKFESVLLWVRTLTALSNFSFKEEGIEQSERAKLKTVKSPNWIPRKYASTLQTSTANYFSTINYLPLYYVHKGISFSTICIFPAKVFSCICHTFYRESDLIQQVLWIWHHYQRAILGILFIYHLSNKQYKFYNTLMWKTSIRYPALGF